MVVLLCKVDTVDNNWKFDENCKRNVTKYIIDTVIKTEVGLILMVACFKLLQKNGCCWLFPYSRDGGDGGGY